MCVTLVVTRLQNAQFGLRSVNSTFEELVIHPKPITLEGHGMRLEPLSHEHRDDLTAAASDGRLWELWFTSVPEPDKVEAYIANALDGQAKGHMLPWVVRELESGAIAGTPRDERGW